MYNSDIGPDFVAKGPPNRLTEQVTYINGIAWAADGKSVIYGSFQGGVNLWRVSTASGSKPQRLELASRATGFPAVSRAGNKLAYPAGGRDVNIWKITPGGPPFGPPESILSSTLPDFDAHLSDDGKQIAYVSDRSGKGNEIYVSNADGTNFNQVTQATGRSQGSPQWSPPGTRSRIAYDAQAENGHRDIYVVDATGGRSNRLTDDASDESRPSWSRDGKWIYFQSNRTGPSEIWKMPATGGAAIRITTHGGNNPLESADGKTLFYQKGGAVIAKSLAAGTEKVVLDSVNDGDFFPVENGLYYVVRTHQPLHTREVRLLNLTTGRSEVLNRFQSLGGQGLSVSPDRKTIIYAGIEATGGEDLMLIQNFR